MKRARGEHFGVFDRITPEELERFRESNSQTSKIKHKKTLALSAKITDSTKVLLFLVDGYELHHLKSYQLRPLVI